MIYLIGLVIIETFIIACLARLKIKFDKVNDVVFKNIYYANENLKRKNSELIRKLEINDISKRNSNNMIVFLNELIGKPTNSHQRYIKLYSMEITKKYHEQMIYMIFYEDELRYKNDYLERKENFIVVKDTEQIMLECKIFVDDEKIDPSLNKPIRFDNTDLYIEEINLYKNKDVGIGTFYIQKLSQEVKRYGIKTISGGLSPRDYKNKNQLIHFYSKNEFKVTPMTEIAWGHIEKML